MTWGDPDIGTKGEGRKYAPLIRFSKYQMNALVQRLIDTGAWEEPPSDGSEMDKEYNAQMAQRVKVTEYNKKTNEARVYFKEGKNDHARDIANSQALMALLSDLIPDPATERLTKTEKETANVETNRSG